MTAPNERKDKSATEQEGPLAPLTNLKKLLDRVVDAEAERDALKAQRDESHAAAIAAHDREAAFQDQLADARARVEELEAALREQDGEPGCCACTGGREEGDEHQRLCWIGAVLRPDRKEQRSPPYPLPGEPTTPYVPDPTDRRE